MENTENTENCEENIEEDALLEFIILNSESIYEFVNNIKSDYDTNTFGNPYVNILFDYTRFTDFIIELSGLANNDCDNDKPFEFENSCDNSLYYIKMNNKNNKNINISSDDYQIIFDSYKYVKKFTKNIKCIPLSYEKWIEYATEY